jgi:hypothetical protein
VDHLVVNTIPAPPYTHSVDLNLPYLKPNEMSIFTVSACVGRLDTQDHRRL